MNKRTVNSILWENSCMLVILFSAFSSNLLLAVPTLNCVNLDVTISCSQSISPSNLPRPTASTDCSISNIVSLQYTDDLSLLSACGEEGLIYRIWTATDDCGESTNCLQFITIINEAPVLDGNRLADITTSCLDDLSPIGSSIATDGCTPINEITVTYSDDVSGLDDCGDSGIIIRTWTATDRCGATATRTQSIVIVNEAPFLDCTNLDQTITCANGRGENDLPIPTVTDDCSDANSITLTFVDDESGLTDCGDSGIFIRTWTATDACGLTATCVQTITINNNAPLLNCPNLDITIECNDGRGENDLPKPTFSDDCSNTDGLTLTYSDNETIFNNCSGTILRTWTATDACGLTATCVQTITVVNPIINILTCENIQIITQNNQIIIEGLTAPNEIIKVFDKDYNIVYQCFANCEETQMAGTFPLGNYVVDLQLYDENWGVICQEQRAVILDNSDPCNGTDCETIPPVLANIPTDMTVECDAVPAEPTTITATDNCDEDVFVEFNEVRSNNDCTDSYRLIRTWTATDNCGNSTSSIQVITIEDTTEPILENISADITINGTDQIPNITVSATDNCDPDVDISFEELTNPDGTEIIRIFDATDNCGNTATAQQIITIIKDEGNACENISITSANQQITIENSIASNRIVKVFDPNWQIIFECTNETCENEIIVAITEEGIYHTDVQLYDSNWEFICRDRQDIEGIVGVEPCDTTICQGDVVLRTQAEVDAFCGCEVIEGDLIIGKRGGDNQFADINSLSRLSNLQRVNGNINIDNSTLNSVSELSNLTYIGGTLAFANNPNLTNLIGLEKVSFIGLRLVFSSNLNLLDVSALSGLKTINRGLLFSGTGIKSISFLSSLETQELARIEITNCNNLTNLDGLENINVLNNDNPNSITLLIAGNDNLTDLKGISNLVSIKGDFILSSNPLLEDCCSVAHLMDENLNNGMVEGLIGISNNASLCNSIEAILQNCQNQPNSLCETVQINKTENSLIINNLSAPIEILKVFDADYNLVYECFADCEETAILTDLNSSRYHILINFYDESWQPICEFRETILLEENNAQNRGSEFQIADFELYPNPASEKVTLDLSQLKSASVQLELVNQFGQKVWEKAIPKVNHPLEKIDITGYQNGLYFLKIQSESRKVLVKKVLINRLY